jgi:hypothetical protein
MNVQAASAAMHLAEAGGVGKVAVPLLPRQEASSAGRRALPEEPPAAEIA